MSPAETETLLTPRRTAAVLLFLFLTGALLRIGHVGDVAGRTPDEATYTWQAQRLVSQGFGELPLMVRQYNQNPAMYMYPPPTRVGYLALLTGMMQVTGVTDERAGRWLSCLVSIASLALLGWIAFRFLPPWPALYSVLCLALSYPDLAIARRAWQDAVMGGVGVLLVWSACEITRNDKHWWNYAVLAAAGSFSVLVKELGLFVYGGCAFYVVVLLLYRRAWRPLAGFLAAGVAGAGLSLYCLMAGAGGLQPVLEVWRHLNEMARNNPYMEYQSGPWSHFIWGFWICGPVNPVLALAALGFALLPKRQAARLALPFGPTETALLRFFSGITVLLVTTILVLPNTQNFRYLAAIYAPMYLMGAMGLWALLHLALRKMPGLHYQAVAAMLAALAIGGAIASYRDFDRVFIQEGTADLAIRAVLQTRR